MAQAATITANDRETTPLAHPFVYRGKDANDVPTFVEPGTTPIADRTLTISTKKSADGKKTRIRVRLAMPIVVNEVINSVTRPIPVRAAYVDCTFTYDNSSLDQERKNIVGIFANALAASQTVVMGSVVGMETVW